MIFEGAMGVCTLYGGFVDCERCVALFLELYECTVVACAEMYEMSFVNHINRVLELEIRRRRI